MVKSDLQVTVQIEKTPGFCALMEKLDRIIQLLEEKGVKVQGEEILLDWNTISPGATYGDDWKRFEVKE